MRLLLTTRFNNHEKLKRTRIPVLVLHGRKDTIIPFSHAEKNYAAIPTRSKYFAELNGDHNDAAVSGGEKYQHAVSAFLRTLE